MKFDLRQWFAFNRWLKLFALILALAVWYVGSSEVYLQGRVRVAVLVVPPEGYTVVSVSPETAEVTVDYPRDERHDDLQEAGIRLVHRLGAEASPGTFDFALTAGDFELPARFRIKGIEPERAQVRLDRLVEKVLPVKYVLEGEPRPGYRVDSVNITPREVNITGPAERLSEMSEINTLPIRVTGRSVSFVATGFLEPIPGAVRMDPNSVGLYLALSPQHKVRRFSGVSIRVMSAAGVMEGVLLDPPEVTVFIKGPERDLDNLSPARLAAYVEVMGLGAGSYDLPVKFQTPPGTTLENTEPAVVKVKIEPSLAPRL